MGYKVNRYEYIDYGVAFGNEMEAETVASCASLQNAWETLTEKACSELSIREGTITFCPYRGVSYQEDPNQGFSDVWYSVLEEEG